MLLYFVNNFCWSKTGEFTILNYVNININIYFVKDGLDNLIFNK